MASPERIGPGIHLVAGGIAGTVGAVATCPLEVVKTRLQSSIYTGGFNTTYHYSRIGAKCIDGINTAAVTESHRIARSLELVSCLRSIIANEGAVGLFKGLGPNLVGVAPSRAIYFFTYANMKMFMNERSTNPDSHVVHSLSAVAAGFVSCTVTNPIWFIKTRLQLDQKKENSLTCRQCIQRVYRADGIRGFWKGITASYVGIAETVVHFVIYEYLKAELLSLNNLDSNNSSDTKYLDFVKCMFAAACSKTCATLVAYPHEVARTRLREEGTKYRNFVQTIRLVYKEEKWKGLYRGITTQLLRQIPNTAILMATYELVVYLYQKSHEDSR